MDTADGDYFLPDGIRRCLRTLTLSEYLSFTAGIALKSLDFMSSLIKEGLSSLGGPILSVWGCSSSGFQTKGFFEKYMEKAASFPIYSPLPFHWVILLKLKKHRHWSIYMVTTNVGNKHYVWDKEMTPKWTVFRKSKYSNNKWLKELSIMPMFWLL